MKATIERATLLKSLGHVQSVVERRNTIPILSNVLMKIDVAPLPDNFVQAAEALKRLKPAPKQAERQQRGPRHGTKADRRADGQRREHRNDRQRHPHRADGHSAHRSSAEDRNGQSRDGQRSDSTRSSYRPEAYREADAGPRMPRPNNEGGNFRPDGGQPKRKFHGRRGGPGGQRRAG